jgi:hypothetical protein
VPIPPSQGMTQLGRGVRWCMALALVHYLCTWLSLFASFIVLGDIDEPRTALREGIALAVGRTREMLLQPLAHSIQRDSNAGAHLWILLNSLLWGTVVGTLLLIGRSRLKGRVANELRD